MSAAVEKIWLLRTGMVVLRSMRRVHTPPMVSMPREDVTLTRAKFNELTAHLVEATMGPVRQAPPP